MFLFVSFFALSTVLCCGKCKRKCRNNCNNLTITVNNDDEHFIHIQKDAVGFKKDEKIHLRRHIIDTGALKDTVQIRFLKQGL